MFQIAEYKLFSDGFHTSKMLGLKCVIFLQYEKSNIMFSF